MYTYFVMYTTLCDVIYMSNPNYVAWQFNTHYLFNYVIIFFWSLLQEIILSLLFIYHIKILLCLLWNWWWIQFNVFWCFLELVMNLFFYSFLGSDSVFKITFHPVSGLCFSHSWFIYRYFWSKSGYFLLLSCVADAIKMAETYKYR